MIIMLCTITFSRNTCLHFTKPSIIEKFKQILYLYEMSSIGKFIERESRLVGMGESGNWGAMTSDYSVSFGYTIM